MTTKTLIITTAKSNLIMNNREKEHMKIILSDCTSEFVHMFSKTTFYISGDIFVT
jgi:hypothetical protein